MAKEHKSRNKQSSKDYEDDESSKGSHSSSSEGSETNESNDGAEVDGSQSMGEELSSDESSDNEQDKEELHKNKVKNKKNFPADQVQAKVHKSDEDVDTQVPKSTINEATASDIISDASFESLGVIPQIVKACDALQWKTATQIQQQAIPPALEGRDVIGLAETGSGKTGAFAIPILQALLKNPQKLFAVCMAPTRELAFQIYEVFQALGQASIGATIVCIVGGVDMTSQAIALAKQPHIIVATPGRLVDHLTHTKGFHLKTIKYLILDEADRMLSMDFEKEINQILDVIPSSEQGRKTMMFSATMTTKVQKLQRASLSDPVKVSVSTKFSTPKQLLQYYMFIPAKYKDCYLAYLINEFAGQSILVFGATCMNVQRLTLMLRNLSFKAICLHGQMDQGKRLNALTKFKAGDRDVLICTDVASRGLDIPSVDVVINYDLPGHGKDYIHRVGRTARAGKSGKAIAMVSQYDVEVYQRLEGLLGKQLPKYDLDEETVLILLERVSEAQRLAMRELKEEQHGGKGKRRRANFEDDEGEEGGVEEIVQQELRKQGFHSSGPKKGRGGGRGRGRAGGRGGGRVGGRTRHGGRR